MISEENEENEGRELKDKSGGDSQAKIEYVEESTGAQARRIALSRGQKAAALACVVALSCLYYYSVNLGQTITYESDNYLNYRFCWEVRDS